MIQIKYLFPIVPLERAQLLSLRPPVRPKDWKDDEFNPLPVTKSFAFCPGARTDDARQCQTHVSPPPPVVSLPFGHIQVD